MEECTHFHHTTDYHLRNNPPTRKGTCFPTLPSLKLELRKQRKHLLGSHISLRSFVCDNNGVNEALIEKMCDVLSGHTLLFWIYTNKKAKEFCHHFYDVVIHSLTYERLRDESVDDIIELAGCLSFSKDVFETVIRELIPPDRIGDLFYFTESYDDTFYTSAFADAVLGAVSVFLGALKNPATENSDKEEHV